MHSALLESGNAVVRYRVMTGEDDDRARRGAKRIVGRSEVALYCKDADTIERTIEALRLSDAELVKRPEAEKTYDWQSAYVEPDRTSADGGGNVLFGVAWYDDGFFAQKAEAYSDRMHHYMFDRLGIAESDIEVTHWRAATAA
ncbi:hypothetical protein ACIBCB_07590 [Streptomyces uncialis]|uniref:hypothetical protein n=1 Tax=Streptomyces uncialis TaxID=1048205 RepID=UPI00379CFFB5|nr:hypothetical protein OG268_24085 [Streptomyces uncialis]